MDSDAAVFRSFVLLPLSSVSVTSRLNQISCATPTLRWLRLGSRSLPLLLADFVPLSIIGLRQRPRHRPPFVWAIKTQRHTTLLGELVPPSNLSWAMFRSQTDTLPSPPTRWTALRTDRRRNTKPTLAVPPYLHQPAD
ncbi:hypothetical protein CLAIMM_01040 [Cladophialophora immunda]|nr:hypothetical protein CLAIMM_01040 [Cladophialophora immunda]